MNINAMIDYITQCDPEVGAAVQAELKRQQSHLELIASENFVTPAVMAAAGSVLTNKYAEGYPGKRYYGGCQAVDVVETLAIERAKKLFGANFANVQAHSGAQANMAVYLALVKPGETVLGMNLAHGGHLTHGSPVNISGLYYNIIPYGVDDATHQIDYDALRKLAKAHKPKMIIAGGSAYPRAIDFKKFSEISKEVGAYLFVDMAHIAGLIAAGLHMNPVPYADVVTSTTHKTLRGTRGGLVVCNDEEMAAKIDSAVFPGIQGGPLMHIIAAKAVAFGEALKPEFKAYQQRVLDNAKALANGLMKRGMKLVSGGTDTHKMLLDIRDMEITGRQLEKRLDAVRITANKNGVPNDPRTPYYTSGVRFGSPAVTTRGLNTADMDAVAGLIHRTATEYEPGNDEIRNEIRAGVAEICKKYPLY